MRDDHGDSNAGVYSGAAPIKARHIDALSRISRREAFSALGAFVLLAGLIPFPAPTRAAPSDKRSEDFLILSSLLTEHDDLDPETGRRMAAAIAAFAPTDYAKLIHLEALVSKNKSLVALLQTASDLSADEALLALSAAWYTGTIGTGESAVCIAYGSALMYRTVADGMLPPTYAASESSWWTAPPPAAHVSIPVQRPTKARPTVGTPEPKS